MKLDRRYLIAGTTLFLAAGSGHIVQNADRWLGEDAGVVVQPESSQADFDSFDVENVVPLAGVADEIGEASAAIPTGGISLPGVPDVAFRAPVLSTSTAGLGPRMKSVEQNYKPMKHVGDNLNQYGLPCDTDVIAEPTEAAMVRVTLFAACRPDQRVEVVHNKLRFSVSTSNTGGMTTLIPALEKTANFALKFPDGEVLTVAADVPDADDFQRVAVQWRDKNEMHIHAYEFGAGFNDDGHVWAGSPRSPAFGAGGKGGFLTTLGDPEMRAPLMAEVYSFPRGESRNTGVVRVSVEAEVTKANCGRTIAAETIQPGVGGKPQAAELTISVPACDATGEFLVLKNILRDLKIARN
ncbi:hypothetical protein [Actibacterium lipolyticum]|uniref:Translocase n=1 Tax=Actibacterium lipolyticum TaxID=1524263 RepID=A0A238KWC6_9RHOB|nr:hypothetical protein [Actibacterium lipolyticum]SMX46891.1 hypothetical protein COL8621_03277 [Actibacterium lipolyticum]